MGLHEEFNRIRAEAEPAEKAALAQIEHDKEQVNELERFTLYQLGFLMEWGEEKLRGRHPGYENLVEALAKFSIPLSGDQFWKAAYDVVYRYELAHPGERMREAAE